MITMWKKVSSIEVSISVWEANERKSSVVRMNDKIQFEWKEKNEIKHKREWARDMRMKNCRKIIDKKNDEVIVFYVSVLLNRMSLNQMFQVYELMCVQLSQIRSSGRRETKTKRWKRWKKNKETKY